MKKNITQTACGNMYKDGDWYTYDGYCDKCEKRIARLGKQFFKELPKEDICDQCKEKEE